MTYIIIRLNSLGNVAMTTPIIHSVGRLNPSDKFVVVAEKDTADFFYGLDNVRFHQANALAEKIGGIRKLFAELMGYKPDAVIDLQNDFYTRSLRMMFLIHGIGSYSVNEHRVKKFWLRRLGYMRSSVSLNAFDGFADVFKRAKLGVDNSFTTIDCNANAAKIIEGELGLKNGIWIGVAPFAKYNSNQLSHRIIKDIIRHLSSDVRIRLFLFGGGQVESEILREWAALYPNTTNAASHFSLACELELMRRIDLMVCMDSANQHLARLVGTRVLTIWCATHKNSGYACWKQPDEDSIEVAHLPCRPCTTNGRTTCRLNTFLCKNIDKQEILNKIYSSLNL